MGQPGNKFRIELPEKEALAGLLKVKPTADMPKRKKRAAKKPRRSEPACHCPILPKTTGFVKCIYHTVPDTNWYLTVCVGPGSNGSAHQRHHGAGGFLQG